MPQMAKKPTPLSRAIAAGSGISIPASDTKTSIMVKPASVKPEKATEKTVKPLVGSKRTHDQA